MVTKSIDLKIWENNKVALYASCGEVDSRELEVFFKKQDSTNLELTGKTVTLYAKKPDGTQIFNNCTVDAIDNSVTVTLTSQFLSSAGIVECEFQIFEGDTVLLKVSGLKIIVSLSGEFSQAIESTSEYNALVRALDQAQTFSDNTGDVEDLTTTDKTSVIAAINELNSKTIPIIQGGTGGTSSVAARTNLEILKAYILYDNDSGNSGTITLNDDSSYYTIIDIILWDFYVFRIYNCNNRPVGISKVGSYGGSSLEWYSESISIISNAITRNGCTYGITSNNTIQFDYTKTIPIRTVIGYKY